MDEPLRLRSEEKGSRTWAEWVRIVSGIRLVYLRDVLFASLLGCGEHHACRGSCRGWGGPRVREANQGGGENVGQQSQRNAFMCVARVKDDK